MVDDDLNGAGNCQPIDGMLSDGVHERLVRVYFEDTDFSGVVYHAAYLKFMERGRSDFLRCLKLSHAVLSEMGMAFGVVHMDIRFLAGAQIDDLLLVHTELTHCSGVRLVFDQKVMCCETLLVTATVTVALIKDGKPQRLPADMQTLFKDLSDSI